MMALLRTVSIRRNCRSRELLNYGQGPAPTGSACRQQGASHGHQTRVRSRPARGRLIGGHSALDPLFQASAPARVGGASVTFEPGARTAWHTRPLGQTLIITAGCGWVQREGGLIEEIRPGDVVWFPPGEKHWHGATPRTAMTHIAIQESLDGKAVEWLEKVSDEQYGK
jgi:quercetin dioxygenase-like cupin family protein